MKKGRTILSQEDRIKAYKRDNGNCFLCWVFDHKIVSGVEFDHAFVLGWFGKSSVDLLNSVWNVNLLCIKCHREITAIVGLTAHLKRICVMREALHRLYSVINPKDPFVRKIYQKYKQRVVFVNQRYEVDSERLLPVDN